MIVLVALNALAWGTVGAALALKSGRASVAQGVFPLVFVILFLSSAFFPRGLLLRTRADDRRLEPDEPDRRGPARADHLGPLVRMRR